MDRRIDWEELRNIVISLFVFIFLMTSAFIVNKAIQKNIDNRYKLDTQRLEYQYLGERNESTN